MYKSRKFVIAKKIRQQGRRPRWVNFMPLRHLVGDVLKYIYSTLTWANCVAYPWRRQCESLYVG